MVKRAEANLLLTAAQTSGWALNAWVPALLTSADAKAAPGTRDYPGAKVDCQKMVDALGPEFKKRYVDDMKPKVTALKALDAATQFVTKELAEIEAMLVQQEAGIAAGRWRQVTLNHGLLKRRIGRAEKMTNRRAAFDVQHVETRPRILDLGFECFRLRREIGVRGTRAFAFALKPFSL